MPKDRKFIDQLSCLWIMGTSASTGPQTVSVAPPSEDTQSRGEMDNRRSASIQSFQTVSIHSNKAKSIITNKVAPVMITYNCKEEFQIHDDLLKANYITGRISDIMPEHYLVQGSYFMVRDVYSKLDVLNTVGSMGAPNFRQAKKDYPVFGMGQPSLNGFRQVLQKLQSDGYKEMIYFCVREEPIVFLHMENDFIPYTPRRRENLHENLHNLGKGVKVEKLELTIKKELHDFAQLNENVYYVYNDIEHFKDEPHSTRISCEEDIHVTEEVYKRPIFSMPSYRYHRLPLPTDGALLEEQFDTFINLLRENPSLLLLKESSASLPALLFSCQVGVGRTSLAMILGVLVLYHRKGCTERQEISENAKAASKERFQVIQDFISMVPKGEQIVVEVDYAISLCSEMHDIKEEIYEYKKKLEGIGEDYQIQGSSTKEYFLQRTLKSLERYLYLVAFNYYLHEQYSLAFALPFSRWMTGCPWIYRLLSNMNMAEINAPGELITKGTRVLVLDERFNSDALSTVREMKVANFRRVPKMPVYGLAQPNSEATASVLGYLTDERRKYVNVLWVNLRDEVVLEGNGQVFSPRDPANIELQITVPATSLEQLEKLETTAKNEILASQKWLEVYLEQEKQMKLFKTCQTMQEVFNQQKSTFQGLLYRRIPIPDCCSPREQDFDRLLEAMKTALAEDSHTAFVFNCISGKGRTTTAMVMAVLILWHFKGIPEVSDDEIVSVPDAKYTKGEFEVVMQLVRLLPDGNKVKKEVDMALDAVSETMTPMHYHLREIIISTYRQMKTAKTAKETELLQLRSLQYLERYIYFILFNTYLHLEKKDSWQRPFSVWMYEVAAKAGVYEILNQLGFSEFENPNNVPPSKLRFRWQRQNISPLPFRGTFI
ncbi:paladin [Protopterus annectens]|uniref:paladin n=1 Tax=Protopterus annectens TaxID=7888 RepID=UPI001CF96A7E|nr:paladin [Protopterus annectens]